MKTWLIAHYPSTIDDDTRELRLPLSKETILVFFGHICSPAHDCDRDGINANDSSALVDVYHSKLLELGQPVDTELRRVLDGYEKVINSLKKRELMKINVGKRQLEASEFEMLVLKLMTITPAKRGQSWTTVLFG
ncbi:hypothetical protein JG687_00011590 [Phytophthora cactorum]|uniref:Uncharacterized protein n=1 Tax=Phytophthora cactorum TaxID=29920 RepID=A0A8T1U8S8_9STRA|nr:hypothetical protein JG687_00011590 [Phytophthora cactorum]